MSGHPGNSRSFLADASSTGDSHEVKQKRVAEFLDRHDLDGILLTLQSNFAWYTDGGRSHVNIATEESIAELLITRLEEHLFVNATENSRLVAEELRRNVQIAHVNAWWEDSTRKSVIATQFGKRVQSDAGLLKYDFARLRYSLLPKEIERYQLFGKELAGVFWEIAHVLRPGMTEFDLAAEVSSRLVRKGIEPLVLLVAFDERAKSYRHPLPTWNALRNLAMVSVCGRRSGLVASASRMISLGAIPEELRRKHRAVVGIDAWLLQQTVPQIRVAEIFRGLKDQYAAAGFPNEWQFHHQGGATGYTTRDYRASEASDEIVQCNQAFAWNPTITGTKSEDTIVVNERGFQILTRDARWPTIEIEANKTLIQRPDFLILD